MLFKLNNCGGCRTCELACAYHHEGVFRPAHSSFKVVPKKNEPGYDVMIAEVAEGNVKVCDGCVGLDVPMCVEYCAERDDLAKVIFELMKSKRKVATQV